MSRINRRAKYGVVATLLVATLAAAAPLPELQWRLLGPFRGGWTTLATGIADEPDTYLFGAAGGGVWKTVNSGRTWTPIFDHAGSSASIGALAVAPSDSKVIYVGTGQPEPRYDIAAGDGVYRSTDGGQSWVHVGLEATRHIGAILVDPHDSRTLLVGALGHMFGPNPERGIYRSVDGGATWSHTLAISADTGVVDLAADPTNPQRIYAAAWEARNYPWLSYFKPIGGLGSAIYTSADGGQSWSLLGGAGWPAGALGRIGLAVTHTAQGTRIYASIDAEEVGGLYRSDDGGAHWKKVNEARAVTNWYTSRLTVAPDNPDVIYHVGQSIHYSRDAGQTFTIIRGAPGGDDYHHLWINPKHPARMAVSSDQGTVISVDGGQTWGEWYNQPTGQFYHLAADNQFPYRVYSGQQDSGTVSIASRSDYGSLNFRDWNPVGGDERDDVLPDPADPRIVYASGLGGKVTRWDARHGQSREITPWPVSSYGKRQTSVKYRYTWITPLTASQRAPYPLYVGSQLVWRSVDQGEHWQIISPDLTGKSAAAARCDGDVALADARACGYGVIFNIAPSPLNNTLIWVGTDDGLVQLTRDAGAHWQAVTPPGLPGWARVNTVDPSALDPETAYVAADNHRQDDFAPYAWRTHDGGRSWQSISAGLPRGHFLAVVRADPVRRGLLYAGTDAGVLVSLDDGEHWQPLQLNLPPAWVRDLLVHGNDLIAATQGRALWVLDDVSPLRALVPGDTTTRLFVPATAYRVQPNSNRDTPLPAETAVGSNPPAGVAIDYALGADVTGVVTLEIHDAQGALVRRYSSLDQPPDPHAHRYFAADWLKPAAVLAATPGLHRFVWDLRYAQPRAVEYQYSIGAVYGLNTLTLPAGAMVVPGSYEVVLKAGGHQWRQPLTVKADPRVTTTIPELQRELAYLKSAGDALDEAFVGHGEVAAVRKQLATLRPTLSGALLAAADAFDKHSAVLAKSAEGTDADFGAISTAITALAAGVEGADYAPTSGQQAALDDYRDRLHTAVELWHALRGGELVALNQQLAAAAKPAIAVPAPAQFVDEPDDEGQDLP
jgi:photosystem II stability/assembly factor-like uncharacterized protein